MFGPAGPRFAGGRRSVAAGPCASIMRPVGLRGGIDLGGTKIQAVVVDDDHQVLGQARVPTPTEGGPTDVADAMASALQQAASEASTSSGELEGVGAGSPGDVDSEAGTVTGARNLPGGGATFPLAQLLQERLGAPARVSNDVRVTTMAEASIGAGRGFRSMLGVAWGTGVGGGLILDGRPWVGRGAAGEIGHMVVKIGGAQCPCGRVGCMEAYAGRAAMERRARKRHEEGTKTDLLKIMEKRGRTRMTSGVWARALDADDKLAIELVDEAVEAIAAAVASVVNLLDVEGVVIAGGLGIRLGEPYVERIGAAMQPHLFVDQRPPEVRLAALGDLGGAIGASLLVGEPA